MQQVINASSLTGDLAKCTELGVHEAVLVGEGIDQGDGVHQQHAGEF